MRRSRLRQPAGGTRPPARIDIESAAHGAARVLQPGDRRADRRGRDAQARPGAGRRRRRRRGPAVLGAAVARRPGAVPAKGGRRAGRRDRRGRRAPHPRAGKADHRELHDGDRPDDRRPPLVRRRRAEDPRRRADPHGAGPVPVEEGQVQLRAARRGRGDRALELPVVDPVRRGGDGADGRQRRRAQAGQPDARCSASASARRSRRRAFPRAWSASSTAAARSAARCASPRRGRSSSPARSRWAARSARSAPRTSRARCSSSAARTRRSSAPTPTSTTRSPAASGAGSRTPARPAPGSSAPTWSRRSPTASSRASCGGRASSRSATRWSGRPRSARWSRRISSASSPSSSTTRSRRGAERVAGGPREVPGFSGKFIAPTVLAGVEDDMRIMTRGDLRPGGADHRRRLRGGGASARQRLELRPRRLGLDEGPRQGRADGAADRVRDGVDQRPLLHPRRLPVLVGRRQGIRARAARTRSSASTSAWTSSSSRGSRG